MEADFLRSLHQTRQLEAELHDALAEVLKVGDAWPSSRCLNWEVEQTWQLEAAKEKAAQRACSGAQGAQCLSCFIPAGAGLGARCGRA